MAVILRYYTKGVKILKPTASKWLRSAVLSATKNVVQRI